MNNCQTDDEEIVKKYEVLKCKIDALSEQKAEMNLLKSKAMWLEEGEKSTKYFLGLGKNRSARKTVKKLTLANGEVTTERAKILKEERLFYEQLFQEEKMEIQDESMFLENASLVRLNEELKLKCEGMLNEKECFEALLTLQNGKSPGNDGLTIEFYKKFWPKIKDYVMDSFNEAYEKGSLSNSQRQGNITLIDKKDTDRTLLKNWRPISLLNVDYKTESKALALRVENVLPVLIHYNQCGFVKGRYIGEAI